MRLGLCVIAFNRREFTEQTLKSILWTRPSDVACVVVDNASTDGTREVIQDFHRRHPEVFRHIILNDANLHLGPAMDQGCNWMLENCDVMSWMANDILVEPRWDWNVRTVMEDLGADVVQASWLPWNASYVKHTERGGVYMDRPFHTDGMGPVYFIRNKFVRQGVRPPPVRFSSSSRGPIPPFHGMMVKRKLRGRVLHQPGVWVRNPEFSKPEYQEYYETFFAMVNRTKKFRERRDMEQRGEIISAQGKWEDYLAEHFPEGEPS